MTSRWGTQTLEERFRLKFPDLRILRIDSQSVHDQEHPAYGCISHLNEILTQYDLIIASPSLETGVFIDIMGYFESVWGIFQGVQPVDSVRQMLTRLRETADRHIWVNKYGVGKVGNGATTIGGLLTSQDNVTQANIALLAAADNEDYSYIDQNFQPESIKTWALRGSAINAQMKCYRHSVLLGLAADGYTIINATDADTDVGKAIEESVKLASQSIYTTDCQKTVAVENPSDSELQKLKEKRTKTLTERRQERKADLINRYRVNVTVDLIKKDDDGWYPQLRMYYYLTIGRQFLVPRDVNRSKKLAYDGDNSIFKPDFNRGQLLSSVLLFEELKILEGLTLGVQLRGSDLIKFKAQVLEHRRIINDYLNITISAQLTPIAIFQKFLAKIGQKLTKVGRIGIRDRRENVYEFIPPDDERQKILQLWLERDIQAHAKNQENV